MDDVFWIVLQHRGVFGVYTDEDEARKVAKSTGNMLTHVPADGDYRPQGSGSRTPSKS